MLLFTTWLYIGLLYSYFYEKSKNDFFIYISITIMVLLSGLRSEYNDTARYIFNFLHIIPSNTETFFNKTNWYTLGNHPLFILFQSFLKEFITLNPHIFIFLTSFIINVSIIFFYKKTVKKYLYFTLFLFIFSGLYMLGMAAIKQMLAISIGIWGIYFYLKNQRFLFIFLIFFASLFHPYVLLYLTVIFFDKNIWTKQTYILLFLTIIIGIGFNYFMTIFVENINIIGTKYNIEYITKAKAMNPFRVLFYSFIPIISYIYRKKIITSKDKILIVSVNFSILTFIFMIIGLYGGANMFGRMGNYFEIFNYIAITKIVLLIKNEYIKLAIITALIIMYTFFFYYQYLYIRPFNYNYLDLNIF